MFKKMGELILIGINSHLCMKENNYDLYYLTKRENQAIVAILTIYVFI